MSGPSREDVGAALHRTVERLFPLPRSLTGDGVRDTLRVLSEQIPLQIHEVPSGTQVLDWTVPPEWRVHGARLTAPDGTVLADWQDDPLHLLGYSTPFRGRLSLQALRPHLHSLPDQPTLIPFRTSYYRADWGFCLPHQLVERLPGGDYDVVVDTELVEGALTYGELVLPGQQDGQVRVSSHTCHPRQANDNLSGLVLAAALAAGMQARERRWTWRFLFAPGTLGAITWLARHGEETGSIRAGLVLTGLGDPSPPAYKRSRRGDTLVDRAVTHVLGHRAPGARLLDFSPYGYDERQFCSPGFDLPVGRLGRGVHGEYPEYHTSADDLDFVRPGQLADSLDLLLAVADVLESDRTFRNLAPYGEPQLGKRGLYRSTGATHIDGASVEMALLWVLNLSDGQHSLLQIADQAQLPFGTVRGAADRLRAAGLLAEVL